MEALGLLMKPCNCHVLKVFNAWLPYKENKAMHFENEASVLYSRRSHICILFRGQKMRRLHSLWFIFLSGKEKKKKEVLACTELSYILSVRTSFVKAACLRGFRETHS